MSEALAVLIVEDDAIIAFHLKSLVAGLGYRVCATVASEEAAVESASQLAPDVILMDQRLQRGGEGTRAAATILKTQDVPIIFCTAHADDPSFIAKASIFGRSAILAKPVSQARLREALESVIGPVAR